MNVPPARSRPDFFGHPQRWFAAILVYTGVPLAVLGLPPLARRIAFWWDCAMALGVLSTAGFALLPLLSARWWVRDGADGPFLRAVQSTHRQLSYVVTLLAVLHIGLLLWLEPRTVEYLLPGAVAPMLAGLAALVCAVFLIVSSLRRQRWHWRYRNWRAWHAALSAALLGLLGWHLIGAGYYFGAPGVVSTLLWLLALPTCMTFWWHFRPASPAPDGGGVRVPVHPGRISLAIGLIWLLAAVVFAGGSDRQPPLRDLPLCAVSPCL